MIFPDCVFLGTASEKNKIYCFELTGIAQIWLVTQQSPVLTKYIIYRECYSNDLPTLMPGHHGWRKGCPSYFDRRIIMGHVADDAKFTEVTLDKSNTVMDNPIRFLCKRRHTSTSVSCKFYAKSRSKWRENLFGSCLQFLRNIRRVIKKSMDVCNKKGCGLGLKRYIKSKKGRSENSTQKYKIRINK